MAEGIQNKKLLIVAIIVGVVFVALYNVQRIREEAARRASRTFVVRVTTDLEPGQVLTEQNVQPVGLEMDSTSLKGLVMWEGEAGLKNGLNVQQVRRRVEKNTVLQLADIGQADALDRGPSEKIRPGWQAVTLQVETNDAPSAYIRRGDRVDVYGKVIMPGKPEQKRLIIEAVEVMAVGGQLDVTTKQDFRSISVQVPNDVVPLLMEALDRVVGKLKLSVRPPDSYDRDIKYPYNPRNPKDGGTIAKPVLDSLSVPLPQKNSEDLAAGAGR